jgi:hypothetical protein
MPEKMLQLLGQNVNAWQFINNCMVCWTGSCVTAAAATSTYAPIGVAPGAAADPRTAATQLRLSIAVSTAVTNGFTVQFPASAFSANTPFAVMLSVQMAGLGGTVQGNQFGISSINSSGFVIIPFNIAATNGGAASVNYASTFSFTVWALGNAVSQGFPT